MKRWKLAILLSLVAATAFAQIYDGANREIVTVVGLSGTVSLPTGAAADATITGRFPSGSTPADNESNSVTITRIGSFLWCFDGSTWDRCPGNSADGLLVNLGANNDVTVTLPNEGQQTAANSISVTPDTDNDAIGAPGAAVPGETLYVGGTDGTNLTPIYVDPCQREARTQFVVDIVTAATTEIANQVASEFFYICSINIGPVGGAVNLAIVEDDTDACASPTAALQGGVTAAEGWNFSANGGIVEGNGQAWIMKTTTANRFLCIITSAAVQVPGTITYVSAP